MIEGVLLGVRLAASAISPRPGGHAVVVVAQFVQQDVHEEESASRPLRELDQEARSLVVVERRPIYPQPVEDRAVVGEEAHGPLPPQLALPGADRDDAGPVPAEAGRIARREEDASQALGNLTPGR